MSDRHQVFRQFGNLLARGIQWLPLRPPLTPGCPMGPLQAPYCTPLNNQIGIKCGTNLKTSGPGEFIGALYHFGHLIAPWAFLNLLNTPP